MVNVFLPAVWTGSTEPFQTAVQLQLNGSVRENEPNRLEPVRMPNCQMEPKKERTEEPTVSNWFELLSKMFMDFHLQFVRKNFLFFLRRLKSCW